MLILLMSSYAMEQKHDYSWDWGSLSYVTHSHLARESRGLQTELEYNLLDQAHQVVMILRTISCADRV